MIVINVVTDFKNDLMVLPEYAHLGDSCVDLQANLTENMSLLLGQQALIPTGLYVALPAGKVDYNWVLDIVPRSGLSHKYGVVVVNRPGKIDSVYRGEIKIILKNTKVAKFIIEPGMRIAQAQLSKAYRISWNQCSELDNTERAAGGFGHTGT